MNLETARSFLLWCSILNYAMLGLWSLLAGLRPAWWYGFVAKLLPISRENFDLFNYGGLMFYKVSIFLLNIVPLIALYIIK